MQRAEGGLLGAEHGGLPRHRLLHPHRARLLRVRRRHRRAHLPLLLLLAQRSRGRLPPGVLQKLRLRAVLLALLLLVEHDVAELRVLVEHGRRRRALVEQPRVLLLRVLDGLVDVVEPHQQLLHVGLRDRLLLLALQLPHKLPEVEHVHDALRLGRVGDLPPLVHLDARRVRSCPARGWNPGGAAVDSVQQKAVVDGQPPLALQLRQLTVRGPGLAVDEAEEEELKHEQPL
mmetsp:Transcript_64222/g.134017  ORF Transcript_64222/g.134017 Transcript_64222/m.134017 type:complete len:231 (-) Transcript_64222:22-714(-)